MHVELSTTTYHVLPNIELTVISLHTKIEVHGFIRSTVVQNLQVIIANDHAVHATF